MKKCFILEIKTDIEKLPKRRTPPISGQFYLHQRCPLIGENTVFLNLYAALHEILSSH